MFNYGGKCYIQTPFTTGEIKEDNTIISAKEKEKVFGQKDYVRIYSIKGLCRRLESVWYQIRVMNYNENPFLGLKNETVIIASK